jgi:hypothetical protein
MREIHWVKAYVDQYKDDEVIGGRLDLEARDVEVGQFPDHFDTHVEGFSSKVAEAIRRYFHVEGLVVEGLPAVPVRSRVSHKGAQRHRSI